MVSWFVSWKNQGRAANRFLIIAAFAGVLATWPQDSFAARLTGAHASTCTIGGVKKSMDYPCGDPPDMACAAHWNNVDVPHFITTCRNGGGAVQVNGCGMGNNGWLAGGTCTYECYDQVCSSPPPPSNPGGPYIPQGGGGPCQQVNPPQWCLCSQANPPAWCTNGGKPPGKAAGGGGGGHAGNQGGTGKLGGKVMGGSGSHRGNHPHHINTRR